MTCEKCACTDITVRFHKYASNCAVVRSGHNKKSKEHLHYTCTMCGYDWTGPLIKSLRSKFLRRIGLK